MAIKKVKLPNNTVVDINDARIPGVDSTPTSGSTNVVTSGGVYTALQNKPNYAHLSSESQMPASPELNTMYLIDGGSGSIVSDVTLGGTSVVSSGVAALPAYPSSLSQLSSDTTHRVVTDTEKSTWDAKQKAITISSTEPTSSQGSDGDIWIVI